MTALLKYEIDFGSARFNDDARFHDEGAWWEVPYQDTLEAVTRTMIALKESGEGKKKAGLEKFRTEELRGLMVAAIHRLPSFGDMVREKIDSKRGLTASDDEIYYYVNYDMITTDDDLKMIPEIPNETNCFLRVLVGCPRPVRLQYWSLSRKRMLEISWTKHRNGVLPLNL
jgi:hypothetical protein